MPTSSGRATRKGQLYRNPNHPKRRYISVEDLPSESNPNFRPVISDVTAIANNDPVLDMHAAAALLGKTYEAFRKLHQRGKGPEFFIVGERSVCFLLSAVLNYRAERTVKR